MKLLTFDPSMNKTGWASLVDDGSSYGILEAAGVVSPDGKELADRVRSLCAQVSALVLEHKPDRVVVEGPAMTGRAWGGFKKQNPMHIPIYGMSVSAVLLGAGRMAMLVPADLWTNCGVIPSTRADPHKGGRVREAAAMYGREVKDFGPRSVAGNVADAVLLGFWVLRVQRAPAVDAQLHLEAR